MRILELLGIEAAHRDPFRACAAQLLAQRLTARQGLCPIGRNPYRLVPDAHGAPVHGEVKSRFCSEEGDAAIFLSGIGQKRSRDYLEALMGSDRGARYDPGLPDVDISDASVVTIEPVTESRLEHLERRGIPAVALE